MKKMTCRQLGGACDEVFQADSFDQMAALSKQHGMEMYKAGDKDHLEAMSKMRKLMTQPDAMQKWFTDKQKEFDALPSE